MRLETGWSEAEVCVEDVAECAGRCDECAKRHVNARIVATVARDDIPMRGTMQLIRDTELLIRRIPQPKNHRPRRVLLHAPLARGSVDGVFSLATRSSFGKIVGAHGAAEVQASAHLQRGWAHWCCRRLARESVRRSADGRS